MTRSAYPPQRAWPEPILLTLHLAPPVRTTSPEPMIEMSAVSIAFASTLPEPAIDTFSPDRLTQSGDYLFVVSHGPSPGKYSVKFKVTN